MGLSRTDVALLAPCYWPEVRRGTERFARELADGLVADGRRPALITSHPGPPSRADEDGLRVIRLPRPPSGALDRRHYEDHLTHLPLSAAALAALRPAVAHALYPTDAVVAGAWSRLTGRPSVLSYMGIPESSWLERKRLRRRALARGAASCDAVVALSRAAADEFRRHWACRRSVIPPGVDLDAFTPGGRAPTKPTIFCAASILTAAKRVEELVAAFAMVRRERPGAGLLLSRPPDLAAPRRWWRAPRESSWWTWTTVPRCATPIGRPGSARCRRSARRSGSCWWSRWRAARPWWAAARARSPRSSTGPRSACCSRAAPPSCRGRFWKVWSWRATREPPPHAAARAEQFPIAACTRAYEDLYDELEAIRILASASE